MEHPKLWVLQRKDFLWNLGNVHLLESYLPIFQEEEELQAMKNILNMFKTEVMPNIRFFRKCINHGDLNDLNILVVPDAPTGHRISGILDLGDMSAGCYVYELAISIMYMMIESPNAMDVAGPLIAGWQSVLPLNEAEQDALYVLVLARFCQSMVLGQHAVAKDPENSDYLSITTRKGKGHLLMLLKMGKEAVHRKWFEDAWEYSGRK
ncbi:hypothetical protein GJAV_G00089180 [Gymnothorax javanicus]|nr:hypothetical protein GJAV_G00089180 [Gymnothorax javanicus]